MHRFANEPFRFWTCFVIVITKGSFNISLCVLPLHQRYILRSPKNSFIQISRHRRSSLDGRGIFDSGRYKYTTFRHCRERSFVLLDNLSFPETAVYEMCPLLFTNSALNLRASLSCMPIFMPLTANGLLVIANNPIPLASNSY